MVLEQNVVVIMSKEWGDQRSAFVMSLYGTDLLEILLTDILLFIDCISLELVQ
jgi:hypothetical protein